MKMIHFLIMGAIGLIFIGASIAGLALYGSRNKENGVFEKSVQASVDSLRKAINSENSLLREISKDLSECKISTQNIGDTLSNILSELNKIKRNISKRTTYESQLKALSENVIDGLDVLLAIKDTVNDEAEKRTIEKVVEILIENLKQIPYLQVIYPRPGESYDPDLHTAVDTIASDNQDMNGKILEVRAIGYKLFNKLYKRAEVVVYKYENKGRKGDEE